VGDDHGITSSAAGWQVIRLRSRTGLLPPEERNYQGSDKLRVLEIRLRARCPASRRVAVSRPVPGRAISGAPVHVAPAGQVSCPSHAAGITMRISRGGAALPLFGLRVSLSGHDDLEAAASGEEGT